VICTKIQFVHTNSPFPVYFFSTFCVGSYPSPIDICTPTYSIQFLYRNHSSKPYGLCTRKLQSLSQSLKFRLIYHSESENSEFSHLADSPNLSSCYSNFCIGSCPSPLKKVIQNHIVFHFSTNITTQNLI
jgi:hypothetical protein